MSGWQRLASADVSTQPVAWNLACQLAERPLAGWSAQQCILVSERTPSPSRAAKLGHAGLRVKGSKGDSLLQRRLGDGGVGEQHLGGRLPPVVAHVAGHAHLRAACGKRRQAGIAGHLAAQQCGSAVSVRPAACASAGASRARRSGGAGPPTSPALTSWMPSSMAISASMTSPNQAGGSCQGLNSLLVAAPRPCWAAARLRLRMVAQPSLVGCAGEVWWPLGRELWPDVQNALA